MMIETVTEFFMWCTIINGALLLLGSIMCLLMQNWIYSIHSKFLAISREAFNVAIYSFLGLFKIAFLIFSVVPYVALLIIG